MNWRISNRKSSKSGFAIMMAEELTRVAFRKICDRDMVIMQRDVHSDFKNTDMIADRRPCGPQGSFESIKDHRGKATTISDLELKVLSDGDCVTERFVTIEAIVAPILKAPYWQPILRVRAECRLFSVERGRFKWTPHFLCISIAEIPSAFYYTPGWVNGPHCSDENDQFTEQIHYALNSQLSVAS